MIIKCTDIVMYNTTNMASSRTNEKWILWRKIWSTGELFHIVWVDHPDQIQKMADREMGNTNRLGIPDNAIIVTVANVRLVDDSDDDQSNTLITTEDSCPVIDRYTLHCGIGRATKKSRQRFATEQGLVLCNYEGDGNWGIYYHRDRNGDISVIEG